MGDVERVLLLGVGLGVLWGIAKVAAAAWRPGQKRAWVRVSTAHNWAAVLAHELRHGALALRGDPDAAHETWSAEVEGVENWLQAVWGDASE